MMLGSTIDPRYRRSLRPQAVVVLSDDKFYTPKIIRCTHLDDATAISTSLDATKLIATNTSSAAGVHGCRIPATDVKYTPINFNAILQGDVQPTKFYWEMTFTHIAGGSKVGVGVGDYRVALIPDPDNTFPAVMVYAANGHVLEAGSTGVFNGLSIGALTNGDTIGIAYDTDQVNGVWFKKVGSGTPSGWNQPSNNPAIDPTIDGTGAAFSVGTTVSPWITFGGTSPASGNVVTAHFGGPFVGAIPVGYVGAWEAAQLLFVDAMVVDVDTFSAKTIWQI